jgi:DNA (cytosine-5)-methyltransferase 1
VATIVASDAAYPINTLTLGGRPDPVNDARMTLGVGNDGDPQFTLQAAHCHAVAVAAFKGGQGSAAGSIGYAEELSPTLAAADSGSNRTPLVQTQYAVRRLTPVECERLQGFPDSYSNIPWRNKPEAPDGPRYKALGNSWAVPVVRWIGERIDNAVN